MCRKGTMQIFAGSWRNAHPTEWQHVFKVPLLYSSTGQLTVDQKWKAEFKCPTNFIIKIDHKTSFSLISAIFDDDFGVMWILNKRGQLLELTMPWNKSGRKSMSVWKYNLKYNLVKFLPVKWIHYYCKVHYFRCQYLIVRVMEHRYQ